MTTGNGKIEIFIAPNRQWTDVGSDPTTNWRIKIGEINQNFSKKMTETRRKGGQRKFLEDFETIEYLIKISTWNDSYTTPIFRWICINYDLINRTKNFGVNG
jgi:hypothetical protein